MNLSPSMSSVNSASVSVSPAFHRSSNCAVRRPFMGCQGLRQILVDQLDDGPNDDAEKGCGKSDAEEPNQNHHSDCALHGLLSRLESAVEVGRVAIEHVVIHGMNCIHQTEDVNSFCEQRPKSRHRPFGRLCRRRGAIATPHESSVQLDCHILSGHDGREWHEGHYHDTYH
jgi:hypothetical protein